ncbi:MAG: hypothetical protein HZA48_02150 [Planctomycetes bacterium]|nr:hypothetical protein [Planctomycetota bacterium]
MTHSKSNFFWLGFLTQIAQIVLLREILRVFSGHELAISIVFVNWLFLTALGAFFGKLAHKISGDTRLPAFYALSIIAYVICIFLSIVFLRGFSHMSSHISGTALSVASLQMTTMAVLFFPCVLSGMGFVTLVKIASTEAQGELVANKGYILESTGAILAGFTLTFVLIPITNPIASAAVAGIVVLLATVLWLNNTRLKRLVKCNIIAVILLAVTCVFSGKIDFMLTRWYYSGFAKEMKLIETENSPYGNIAVLEYKGQYNVFQSGNLVYSLPAFNESAHIAHIMMAQAEKPQKVLLVGGSLSGFLKEFVKYPGIEIDCVEPDPLLFTLAQKYADPETAAALKSKNVFYVPMDGRMFVKRATWQYYDVVIVNAGEPNTAMMNRYFTVDFFAEINRILKKDGVFGLGAVKSGGQYLGGELLARNACLYFSLREVFDYVQVTPWSSAYFICGDSDSNVSLDAVKLAERYNAFGVKSEFFAPALFETFLQESEVANINGTLKEYYDKYLSEKEKARVNFLETELALNTDFKPTAYFLSILLWNKMHKGGAIGLNLLPEFDFKWIYYICGGVLAFMLFLRIFNRGARRPVNRRIALLIIIFIAGFCGMVFELLLLNCFQSVYGFVYHLAGLIVAVFMLGITGGAVAGARISGPLREDIDRKRQEKIYSQNIQFFLLMMFFYALLMPLTLSMLKMSEMSTTLLMFLILTGTAGMMVGVQFPMVLRLAGTESDTHAKMAGWIYGMDLLGGCLGAALTGLLFMPIFGINITCICMAVMIVTGIFVLTVTEFRNVVASSE